MVGRAQVSFCFSGYWARKHDCQRYGLPSPSYAGLGRIHLCLFFPRNDSEYHSNKQYGLVEHCIPQILIKWVFLQGLHAIKAPNFNHNTTITLNPLLNSAGLGLQSTRRGRGLKTAKVWSHLFQQQIHHTINQDHRPATPRSPPSAARRSPENRRTPRTRRQEAQNLAVNSHHYSN